MTWFTFCRYWKRKQPLEMNLVAFPLILLFTKVSIRGKIRQMKVICLHNERKQISQLRNGCLRKSTKAFRLFIFFCLLLLLSSTFSARIILSKFLLNKNSFIVFNNMKHLSWCRHSVAFCSFSGFVTAVTAQIEELRIIYCVIPLSEFYIQEVC